MPGLTNNDLGACNCPSGVTCTVKFKVTSCGQGIPETFTVNIYDHSGGTLLATGTSPTGGFPLTLTWPGTSTTVYATVNTGSSTTGRINNIATTVPVTCGSATVVDLRVQTTVGGAYACVLLGCPYPASTTLHATVPVLGAVTLTYNVTSQQWEGTAIRTVYYPPYNGYPGLTVTITCTVIYNISAGGLQIRQSSDNGVDPPIISYCTFNNGVSFTCPPALSMTWQGIGADWTATGACGSVYGANATATVTE